MLMSSVPHSGGRECLKLATLLSFSLCFALHSTRAEDNKAMLIAKSFDLPGRRHTMECQIFADELFRRLDNAGIKAYKITFNWESYTFYARQRKGAHIYVVFQDSRGRYYGMDNMSTRPVWLQGHGAAEWTEFFAGMDTGTDLSHMVASHAVEPNTHVKSAVAGLNTDDSPVRTAAVNVNRNKAKDPAKSGCINPMTGTLADEAENSASRCVTKSWQTKHTQPNSSLAATKRILPQKFRVCSKNRPDVVG
ncbi:MAG: hypothetical protein WCP33_07100 [Deltaproteobacteria bacterium]